MIDTYKKFKDDFVQLLKDGKLNIDSLEILMLNNYKDYKKQIQELSELLLREKINEKELIYKKKNVERGRIYFKK